jgi:HPt (histidine-containing phosphotransfer) domain-containing protein
VDIAALAAELGLEEGDVRRLVRTFLEATAEDLAQLSRAYADGDADELGSIAHHIRGAASNLELGEIAEAALAIEANARSGLAEDPVRLVERIRTLLGVIRAELTLP